MKQKKTITLAEVIMKLEYIRDSKSIKKIILMLFFISVITCQLCGEYEIPNYSQENCRILEQTLSYFTVENEKLCINEIPDDTIKYSVTNIDGGYKISLEKGKYKLNANIVNGKKTITMKTDKTGYLFDSYILLIIIAPVLTIILYVIFSVLWLIIYFVFSVIEKISERFKKSKNSNKNSR